ncbi:MAG: PQQ-dependent sugar dehydrogenase [Acidimicrobiia bacterium]
MMRAGRYRISRFTSVGLSVLAPLLLGAPTSAPAGPPRFDFVKGVVAGTDTHRVTTLQFGPDGRLYVGQQNGLIKAFTLVRHGPGSYQAVAGETIGGLVDLANHDDDGKENSRYVGRLLTGLVVSGTAARPVIHAVTTDPRIGGGTKKVNRNLDTNSGVLSRLTWDGSAWQRLDLVRGLPRSEENHAGNGLVLDRSGERIFLAQGGNTNNGAPSEQFVLTPEYALSAAILSIDLAAIGESTYDLPTLDDPARPGPDDAGDPFGGADGDNQARLVPGGPVQVHAPGFRNAYDLVLTAAGVLYAVDNGSNPGFGAVPVPAGGRCTNQPRAGGEHQDDVLHKVTPGYYGGHPNPTRANPENRFAGQSPVEGAAPSECEYRVAEAAGALATFPASTNGIVEYRSRAFGGAMAGDLLLASFDNRIYRVDVDPDGRSGRSAVLFDQVGSAPLDVTTQDDGGAYPGTIWVGDVADGSITVFEPAGAS